LNDSFTPSGRERRAFERHPVDLMAEVRDSDSVNTDFHIRDVCIGGMLLVKSGGEAVPDSRVSEFPFDALIQIRFSLPDSPVNSLQARVVRSEQEQIGVALVNPDLTVLQKVLEFATNQETVCADEGLVAAESQYLEVINACVSMVTGILPEFAKTSLEGIANEMFEVAKATTDITEQNSYFNALTTINNCREKFITDFSSATQEKILVCVREGGNCREQATATSLDTLSLVEDEALDNWLADTGTIESVERTHNEVLTQLEKRLSLISGQTIKRDNNPFGPAVFSQTFQTCIQVMGLRHNIEMFCSRVFKNQLIDALGNLYERLNAMLIEQGILPEMKYEIDIAESEATSAEQPAQAEPPVQELPDTTKTVQQAQKHSSPAMAEQVPAGQSSPAHDIYELVHELRHLKERLTPQASADAVEAKSPVRRLDNTDDAALVVHDEYSPDEVINALSSMQPDMVSANSMQLREQVLDWLGQATSDDEDRTLGVRENRIMDVSTRVFNSLLDDMQIQQSMRSWISQLKLPVMKMAIVDDTVFSNRNHIVRDVVNKISQLGVLVEAEGLRGDKSVQNALDWLVTTITNDFDGTVSVFERVGGQVDLLLTAQDAKYEKNVTEVINRVSKLDTGKSAEDAEQAVTDENRDLESWRRKVGRLKVGDWLFFEADTDKPKMVRTAWIARRTRKIVFVEPTGKMERNLGIDELAAQLLAGSAMLLDDADEPAMDRAQYSMLQELNQQLIYESTHDQLTGLIDRRQFEMKLGQALESAQLNNERHALCYIDLDQFNVINTTYGYEAGDHLLKEISGLLGSGLEGTGVLARIGNDEFGLLLEDVGLEDALDKAEQFIHMLHENRLTFNDQRVSVGISIGLVPVTERCESITSIMQAAESSCSMAKGMGGNRLQLYHEGHAQISKRNEIVNWMSKIDDVLEQDRLKLRCQKIIPLAKDSQAGCHYEILLCMFSEQGKPVSIQEFVQAAEWSNRVTDIDRWVVSNALDWIDAHHAVLSGVESFSINLSGRSLSNKDFIEFVVAEMGRVSVPASMVCFEITETVGVESLSDSADFINQIKETGCRFSLDDFGSGMSSYAYLKNLPVDYLKIDGIFVKDMRNVESDFAVVKSICEIAHFMGKHVVAEYVEDAQTLSLLTDMGVDYAQGFYVSRPVMLDELVVL